LTERAGAFILLGMKNIVETRNMATVKLRLKMGAFDGMQVSRHKLSQIGQVSYPTVLKYVQAEDVDNFSGPVLYTMLSVGLGLTDEQIGNIRLGDLFEVEGES